MGGQPCPAHRLSIGGNALNVQKITSWTQDVVIEGRLQNGLRKAFSLMTSYATAWRERNLVSLLHHRNSPNLDAQHPPRLGDAPNLAARTIMIVVTSDVTAALFVSGLARFLAEHGHDVLIVANQVDRLTKHFEHASVRVRAVPIAREPSPWADLISLVRLFIVVREERPDILAYATPKASLLSSITGALLNVPVRVYQLWGLRLETVIGPRRLLLACFERLSSRLSTHILANSRSLASRYRDLGLSGSKPLTVIGKGSSHGVDLLRFSREATRPPLDDQTRAFLETSSGLTVGFVGRINPDKGVDTLIDAVLICKRMGVDVRLVLVGRDEGALSSQEAALYSESLHWVGHVDDPRPYYDCFDVLVLPSRREGFPNVVIEAAAMGVPAVVTDATGVRDAIVDGKTGILVPVDAPEAIAHALIRLSTEPSLREKLAAGSRKWVEANFGQESVWNSTEKYLLGAFTNTFRVTDRGEE